MFAKLYGEDEDQILVLLQESDEGEGLEVAFMFQPSGMGLCSVSLGFSPNESGSETEACAAARNCFDEVDEMMAMRIVSKAIDGMQLPAGGSDA